MFRQGQAQGIKCRGDNKSIRITNYNIGSVKCGAPSTEGLKPNPMVNCDCIAISEECYDEISITN